MPPTAIRSPPRRRGLRLARLLLVATATAVLLLPVAAASVGAADAAPRSLRRSDGGGGGDDDDNNRGGGNRASTDDDSSQQRQQWNGQDSTQDDDAANGNGKKNKQWLKEDPTSGNNDRKGKDTDDDATSSGNTDDASDGEKKSWGKHGGNANKSTVGSGNKTTAIDQSGYGPASDEVTDTVDAFLLSNKTYWHNIQYDDDTVTGWQEMKAQKDTGSATPTVSPTPAWRSDEPSSLPTRVPAELTGTPTVASTAAPTKSPRNSDINDQTKTHRPTVSPQQSQNRNKYRISGDQTPTSVPDAGQALQFSGGTGDATGDSNVLPFISTSQSQQQTQSQQKQQQQGQTQFIFLSQPTSAAPTTQAPAPAAPGAHSFFQFPTYNEQGTGPTTGAPIVQPPTFITVTTPTSDATAPIDAGAVGSTIASDPGAAVVAQGGTVEAPGVNAGAHEAPSDMSQLLQTMGQGNTDPGSVPAAHNGKDAAGVTEALFGGQEQVGSSIELSQPSPSPGVYSSTPVAAGSYRPSPSVGGDLGTWGGSYGHGIAGSRTGSGSGVGAADKCQEDPKESKDSKGKDITKKCPELSSTKGGARKKITVSDPNQPEILPPGPAPVNAPSMAWPTVPLPQTSGPSLHQILFMPTTAPAGSVASQVPTTKAGSSVPTPVSSTESPSTVIGLPTVSPTPTSNSGLAEGYPSLLPTGHLATSPIPTQSTSFSQASRTWVRAKPVTLEAEGSIDLSTAQEAVFNQTVSVMKPFFENYFGDALERFELELTFEESKTVVVPTGKEGSKADIQSYFEAQVSFLIMSDDVNVLIQFDKKKATTAVESFYQGKSLDVLLKLLYSQGIQLEDIHVFQGELDDETSTHNGNDSEARTLAPSIQPTKDPEQAAEASSDSNGGSTNVALYAGIVSGGVILIAIAAVAYSTRNNDRNFIRDALESVSDSLYNDSLQGPPGGKGLPVVSQRASATARTGFSTWTSTDSRSRIKPAAITLRKKKATQVSTESVSTFDSNKLSHGLESRVPPVEEEKMDEYEHLQRMENGPDLVASRVLTYHDADIQGLVANYPEFEVYHNSNAYGDSAWSVDGMTLEDESIATGRPRRWQDESSENGLSALPDHHSSSNGSS